MKIIRVLYNAVSILIVAVFLFTVGLRIAGVSVYAVATQSMEDELFEGDMVFVRASEQYLQGDIITAKLPGEGTFTHRIISVDSENGVFYTKGDNNPKPDPAPTKAENIVGKVIFSVPALGKLALSFNPTAVILVLAGILVALIVIRFILFKIKKPKEETV